MSKHTLHPWHESETGTHQALITSEVTGENIAIVYDKRNAPIIKAAPDLLEALEAIIAHEGHLINRYRLEAARSALADAINT